MAGHVAHSGIAADCRIGLFQIMGAACRRCGRARCGASRSTIMLQPYSGWMTLLVVLLVVWLVLAIVGFAIKGLVWLGIIGIVLFVGTAILSLLRRRATSRKV
jgi:hypothetical protein